MQIPDRAALPHPILRVAIPVIPSEYSGPSGKGLQEPPRGHLVAASPELGPQGEARAGQGRGADPRRDIHRSHPSAGIRGKGAGISIGALTALTGGAAAVNTHYPPLNDTGLGEPGKRKKIPEGGQELKAGEKNVPETTKGILAIPELISIIE